jgi:hypothetical protein
MGATGFGLPVGEPVYQAGGVTYVPVKTADLHRQSHVSENPVPPYMASPGEETLRSEDRSSWRGGGMSPTGEQRYVCLPSLLALPNLEID